MGKLKHRTLLHQLMGLLMALHVINVSIDAPGPYDVPTYFGQQHKDLSINEIESFSELLLEECLGLDDAFPEHDDTTNNHSGVASAEQDYFFPQPFVFSAPPISYWYLSRQAVPFKPAHAPMHVPEISSPPPQRLV